MIDRRTEKLVRLSDLPLIPHLIPPGPDGKRVSLNTVNRWVRVGIRGVRLEVASVGGSRLTSVEAFERFNVAIDASRGHTSKGSTRALEESRRSKAEAKCQLAEKMGL